MATKKAFLQNARRDELNSESDDSSLKSGYLSGAHLTPPRLNSLQSSNNFISHMNHKGMTPSPGMRLPFTSPGGESSFYAAFVDSSSTPLSSRHLHSNDGAELSSASNLSLPEGIIGGLASPPAGSRFADFSPKLARGRHHVHEEEDREEEDREEEENVNVGEFATSTSGNHPYHHNSTSTSHGTFPTQEDTKQMTEDGIGANAVTPASRARSHMASSKRKKESVTSSEAIMGASVSPETPAVASAKKKKTAASASAASTTTTAPPPDKRRASMGKWTYEEDEILRVAVEANDARSWKTIALSLPGRTDVQCLHRWQKVLKPGLIKGPWTEEEDDKVLQLVEKYGQKKWSTIAKELGGRLGKQCRERWYNHLNPDIKKGNWSKEEDAIIMDSHRKMGNKWAKIAAMLPGRTDNAIKNRWNSTLKKLAKADGDYKVPSVTATATVNATVNATNSAPVTTLNRKRKAKSSVSLPTKKVAKMQDEETVTKILAAASTRMKLEPPRESYLSPTRQITREDDLIAAEALSVLSSPKLHSPVPRATATFESFTPGSCKITYSESNTIFSPVKTDGKDSSSTVSNSSGSQPNSPKYPLYRHKAMPTTPIRSDCLPPRPPLLEDKDPHSIERTDSIMDDADSLLFLSKSVKS